MRSEPWVAQAQAADWGSRMAWRIPRADEAAQDLSRYFLGGSIERGGVTGGKAAAWPAQGAADGFDDHGRVVVAGAGGGEERVGREPGEGVIAGWLTAGELADRKREVAFGRQEKRGVTGIAAKSFRRWENRRGRAG